MRVEIHAPIDVVACVYISSSVHNYTFLLSPIARLRLARVRLLGVKVNYELVGGECEDELSKDAYTFREPVDDLRVFSLRHLCSFENGTSFYLLLMLLETTNF